FYYKAHILQRREDTGTRGRSLVRCFHRCVAVSPCRRVVSSEQTGVLRIRRSRAPQRMCPIVMCTSWIRCVLEERTTNALCTISLSLPPPLPTHPSVCNPRWCASSTARTPFGELPLVLIARRTSPEQPNPAT